VECSGREPRADGVPAALEAAKILRHRGAGGDLIGRTHRGQYGQSFLKREGREAVIYPHRRSNRARPQRWRAAISGAVAAHGHDRANFTGGEAEELRRAMGFKRSEVRIEPIRRKAACRHDPNESSGERRSRSSESPLLRLRSIGFPDPMRSFALIAMPARI